ncbi:sister chromatid cohesion protein DCC1-like isoform X2 [Homarus americanus]|nr:sister chromatid cohesion protein DCC1-like isoform X2 [Homarus americanus]
MLEFSSDFGDDKDEVVLLELDPKLLDSIKEESAVLRGEPEEGAMLCTKSKTYEVRYAETSNSMVLIPNLTTPSREDTGERTLHSRQVCGIHYTFLEVRPCKPRVQKLRQLLEEQPYSGQQEKNQDGKDNRYTLSDLLDRVQCSEEELDKALQEVEAYHLYGFWQLLEFDYHFKVVSHILALIESKSWPLDGIPRMEAIKALSELEPLTIMMQCFDYYLKPTDKDTDEGDTLYTLHDDKVCRLCAEVLLKSADKYNFTEFLNIWQQSVPEGLTTSLSQLEGLALVDRSATSDAIFYFPVTSLPHDIQKRFNLLFETREKWSFEEIRPYVEDLAGDKTPVSALLTKYARGSTVNGIKYYSGKHAR